ncbi:hypothetical protein [Anaerotruncus rubiinfantis]|uniref:hypothetical protein n=1 Tax=Anaerotruncus rubiinfantis TaxID=1720200 RepID=UPI0018987E4E|nr:hypothetical protein [Anaerotruncus rubiinfantis]
MDQAAWSFLPLLINLIIFGGMAVGVLAGYLLSSFGLYGIAKSLGTPNGWLAFIPYARSYLHGSLAGEIPVGRRVIRSPGLWMVIVPLVESAAVVIGYVIFFVVMFLQMIPAFERDTPPAGLFITILLFWGAFVLFLIAAGAVKGALTALVNFSLYEKYMDRNRAVLHMALGLLVPLYQPVFLFLLGGKEPLGVRPRISGPPPAYGPAQ